MLRYMLLFLLGLVITVPGITQMPPVDRDEARFVQATKQMVETGDFVNVRFQDEPRDQKPVGIHWLQSAALSLFGGSDAPVAAYRIVSVIAIAAAVAAMYWVGQAMFGPVAGLIAALMLAGTFGAGFEGRLAKADSAILFLSILAQGCLARIYLAARKETAAPPSVAWVFWAIQGVALLIKGPIIAFLSAVTIVAIVVFDRDQRHNWLTQLKPLPGIGLMVLITLPWLIYVLLNGGSAYWTDLVGGDLFHQLISGEDYPSAWPGYYFVTYSLYMWPFGLVAVIGGTYAIRRMQTDPRLLFCIAWYVPFWLILELYPMKLPHFVLPAYPALLLLGGWFLSRIPAEIDKPRWWQSLVHGLTGFGVIFVTLGFAVITIVVPVYIAADFTFWSIPMVLLLVMACWFGLGYGLELSPVQRVAVAMVTATAAYGLMFAMILPSINQIWVSRQIADRFNELKACEDSVLASVTYHEPSLVFLTGTQTLLAGPGSAADHLLSDPECAMAAVPDEDAPAFRTALTAAGATAESGELISGFNYSRGKQIAVRLYRINGG